MPASTPDEMKSRPLNPFRRAVRRAIWQTRAARHYPQLLPPHRVTARDFAVALAQARRIVRDLLAFEAMPENRDQVIAYSSDYWLQARPRLQQYVLEDLSWTFQRSPLLGRYFVNAGSAPSHLPAYRDYLFSASDALMEWVERGPVESRIGCPWLHHVEPGLIASSMTIEHLYYIARILRHTEPRVPDPVVELGGGLGNLARIHRLLAPEAVYVDIDYPEMLGITFLYLRLNFPDLPIRVALESKPAVVESGVTLLPVWLVGNLEFKTDLFVSALALSESANALTSVLAASDFLGCRRLFLLGSDDVVFRSAGTIRRAVGARFGPHTFHESPKPGCYEALAYRQAVP